MITVPAHIQVIPETIICDVCGGESFIRRDRTFLCARCALSSVPPGPLEKPPLVVCDTCGREALVRVYRDFLCATCFLERFRMGLRDVADFTGQYARALERYLDGSEGRALASARELGSQALDRGFGAEDMVAVHRKVLAATLRRARSLDEATRRASAVAALLEGYLQPLETRFRRSERARAKILRRLVETREEERQRIAMDIHDDTTQVMTAVGMRLEVLRRRVRDPKVLRELDELEQSVRLAIARLRYLMFELWPQPLDRKGLVGALLLYLERTKDQFGLDFHLESHLSLEPPPEIRTILYRIAQESVTNVRKHARATCVTVVLDESEGGTRVRIEDDGVGFAPDEAAETPGHIGLPSMRERAEVADGWFRVTSASGAGSTVEFWVPSDPGHKEGPSDPRAGGR